MAMEEQKVNRFWHWWMWVSASIFIWWIAAGRLQYHKMMQTWGPDTAYYLAQGFRPGPDGNLWAPQSRIMVADGYPIDENGLGDPPSPRAAAMFPQLLMPGDRERMAAKEKKDQERLAFRNKGH
jgi:hypothetical protein